MMKYFSFAALLCIIACSGAPKEIIIGGIFDQSGPTSDVGRDYADGVIDYIKEVNGAGGINKRKINFLWKDCKYKISEAYAWYDIIREKKAIAIIGWGTGDTEALAPRVTADRIPFISASYSERIADGKTNPYNFIGSVSYSDQARIALKYINNENKNAKVAFIYNDTGFGRSPFFPDAEEFARANNIAISDKIIIPLTGEGALEKLKTLKADWVIVQQSSTASIAVVRAIKRLGLPVRIMLLNWAIDENVVRALGPDTAGVFGTIAYGTWDDINLPAIKNLHEINARYHPEMKERTCRYVQGFINARILLEAVKRAGDDLTREQIKEELEKLEEFDTGASYSRVTYTERLHKPSSSLKLYSIANGKLVPLTTMMISIEQKIWTEL